MLSSLMKNDSHRVEYLNYYAVESGRALGLYVRGHLAANQPYSVDAKRRLFASLEYVNRYLDKNQLAAVYVDVHQPEKEENLAFYQLVEDIRKGILNKVLMPDLEEMFEDLAVYEMLMALSDEVEDLELVDLRGNVFQANKVPVYQLLGV